MSDGQTNARGLLHIFLNIFYVIHLGTFLYQFQIRSTSLHFLGRWIMYVGSGAWLQVVYIRPTQLGMVKGIPKGRGYDLKNVMSKHYVIVKGEGYWWSVI